MRTAADRARDALRELGIGDARAPDDVLGAGFGGLTGLRGAAPVGAGLATRATGAGGGGPGISLGGIFADRHGASCDDGCARGPLAGVGRHRGATVKPEPMVVTDGLTRAEIQRVLDRVLPQIRSCYENELGHAPDLEGKVVTSWTITAAGSVASPGVVQSTFGAAGAPVGACVVHVIGRLKFPSPRGGGQVVVSYPFVFSVAG